MKKHREKHNKNTEVKNASFVSVLTLISRILGLLRDILLATVFGASFVLDAFVLGFTIPNFLRRLLGEGLFSAIFTPIFQSKEIKSNNGEAQKFSGEIFCYLLFLVILYCLLGILFCLACMFFVSDENKLVLSLTSIMLPYSIFICSIAFFSSILHAVNHFIIPALSPIILNIVWVTVLALLVYCETNIYLGVYIVSVCVVLAGILQVIPYIPIMKYLNVLPTFTCRYNKKNMQPFLKSFSEGSVGIMIVQINVLLDRVIAWFFITEAGAVTVLYMANRFVQFPLALIGISIATVAFPNFSKEIINGNMQGLQRLISKTLSITLLFSFPATVGLFLLSPELMALFYGSFATKDVLRIAQVLCIYSLAVWIFCTQQILNKVFYSIRDTKTPMKISCISVTVNVVLNFLLVHSFSELGLAIATVISAAVALLSSFYYLKVKLQFSIIPDKLFFIKVILATGIMGIFVYIQREVNIENLGMWHSVDIIITVLGAVALYFFCIWSMKVFSDFPVDKNSDRKV
ncbi:murein biosynthesis integral membrane protein MurJ [Candidatus Uabimicrobium sp. HlEnr_7]|uniref:murein biosynthesis integral membrane protein MurJ n=1 Tax=Candidatus Uabimicrobium helgolandensis TaxID=3095367 RepID=UPI003559218B